MSEISIDAIQAERAAVLQNITNLEGQVAQLNQQLQTLNSNLLASRGAVLAFDRVLGMFPPTPPAPTVPVEVLPADAPAAG